MFEPTYLAKPSGARPLKGGCGKQGAQVNSRGEFGLISPCVSQTPQRDGTPQLCRALSVVPLWASGYPSRPGSWDWWALVTAGMDSVSWSYLFMCPCSARTWLNSLGVESDGDGCHLGFCMGMGLICISRAGSFHPPSLLWPVMCPA